MWPGRLSRRQSLPGLEESGAEPLKTAVEGPDFSWLEALAQQVLHEHEPELKLPPLRVSSRMTRTLGLYDLQHRRISLSARLVAFGSRDECRRILLHELAHAIVQHRTPSASGHGREFKAICRELAEHGVTTRVAPVRVALHLAPTTHRDVGPPRSLHAQLPADRFELAAVP